MTSREPIAVVGAGCRLPGRISGHAALWTALEDERDLITEVPPDRWALERVYDPDPTAPGRTYTRWGAFLDDVRRFDADFFGISPREARQMDPQQRLLLEVAWEALEDAGTCPQELHGSRTGVFTGGLGSDYLIRHVQEGGPEGIDPWYASGKEPSFGPGRLAYVLGVHGPVMSVSTACSSSLVATHLARQSLLLGECDTALVGGVNVMLAPELTIFMSKVGAMARDGRCKPFSAAADGIVRGEGAVVLVLKRLSDALADGNDVLAVLAGSAVNHDGPSAGLTVPNGAAQQMLIREAVRDAGLEPRQVAYVEAHGTGTPLGDPIELESLARVLCEGRDDARPLHVGSVKSNVGHTDAAAGLLGLLKAVLVVRHGRVPATLHLTERTPRVQWDRWPLQAPAASVALPAYGPVRVAGVSAFGLSGTNAHVVVAEAPAPASAPPPLPAVPVLALSARSADALDRLARLHVARLRAPDAAAHPASDLAAAALLRPHHRDHRLAVTGSSPAALADRLEQGLRGLPAPGVALGSTAPEQSHRVVLAYSGQGAQWSGMARALLGLPAFAEPFATVSRALARSVSWSPLDVLRGEDPRDLADTDVAQPMVFAVQYALTALLRACGVHPVAVVGHSMGEIAAAVTAGVLELDDAARLVSLRGRLLRATAGRGRMVAVRATAQQAAALARTQPGRAWVSATNGPSSAVLSVRAEAWPALRAAAEELGLPCRDVSEQYAFHSPLVQDAADRLVEQLGSLRTAAPALPVHSTVRPGVAMVADAAYWGDNVALPVQFDLAVQGLAAQGLSTFLELGPHPTLCAGIGARLAEAGLDGTVHAVLRRDHDDLEGLAAALGALYAAGVDVDWSAVVSRPAGRPGLPTYPWGGREHWFDSAAPGPARPAPPQQQSPTAEQKSAAAEQKSAAAEQKSAAAEQRPAAAAGEPSAASPVQVTEIVAGAVAQVLGFDDPSDVRRTVGFADLGMDSVGSVALVRLLRAALGVELSATAAFDHPDVERLASHARSLLGNGGDDDQPAQPTAVVAHPQPLAREPIAVVGIGCRFPGGVSGPEHYAQLLLDGVDATGPIPADRFGDGHAWPGGYLAEVDTFDAAFFGISAREARALDPQHRLLLEVTWEALEHAGQPASSLRGTRTGVFMGLDSHDYGDMTLARTDEVDATYGLANTFAAASGRISYFLGAQGPSIALDTACSSSLVAVHQACASLWSGESELAVAGGVNLVLQPTIHLASRAGGALAADGRCKAFDASADGYARGEGAGVVVLKPLSRARADGDVVHAVLLGSAVNQDGASSGLTVPNGQAQTAVLTQAWAAAGVRPGDIGYVEAHGTGTALGDPIELTALGAALGDPRTRRTCLVGSAKSNLGHLEAAAGVAGLIKAVLAVRSGVVPASLHVTRPTPEVDWDQLGLAVPTLPTPWPATAGRRVAGVSAFGFTGTNAHVVVAQVDAEPAPTSLPALPSGRGATLVPLSAASPSALRQLAGSYAQLLRDQEPRLADVQHTAALRRSHLPHRAVVQARTVEDAVEQLAGLARGERGTATVQDRVLDGCGDPVLVFSGYGSHWSGMGRELLDSEPVFARAVAEIDVLVQERLGWSLVRRLRGDDPVEEEQDQQLLIFAVQVGLTALVRSAGLRPGAVVGHSMGEIAAAHAAGALSLASAVDVMIRRTRLLVRLRGQGGMAVVGLPAELVAQELLDRPDLVVAVVNSRSSTVVSGSSAALAELEADLKSRNVFFRTVNAGGPAHGPLAAPLGRELAQQLTGLRAAAPTVPFYSSVHGDRLGDRALDAAYWGQNLASRVEFSTAVEALSRDGYRLFLELSPHPLLVAPIEQDLRAAGRPGRALATLERDADGSWLRALAQLHVTGAALDWRRLDGGGARHVDLPRYPFERKRFWLASPTGATGQGVRDASGRRHPWLSARGADLQENGPDDCCFVLSGQLPDRLQDETLQPLTAGIRTVRPGTWLQAALFAARTALGEPLVELRRLRFDAAVLAHEGQPLSAQVRVASTRTGGPLDVQVSGRSAPVLTARVRRCEPHRALAGPEARVLVERPIAQELAAGSGLTVRHGGTADGTLVAELSQTPSAGGWDATPELLDVALLLPAALAGDPDCEVTEIDAVQLHGCGEPTRVAARARGAAWDVDVTGSAGQLLLTARGVRSAPRRVREADAAGRALRAETLQRLRWVVAPEVPAGPRGEIGTVLVLDDGSEVAAELCDLLAAEPGGVRRLPVGDGADPDTTAARVRLLLDDDVTQVVLLHAGQPAPGRQDGTLAAAGRLEAVHRAVSARGGGRRPRLWTLTRGAQPLNRSDASTGTGAALWPVARALGAELPAGWGGLVDVDPMDDPRAAARTVLCELTHDDREDNVAWRGGRRFVARLSSSDLVPQVALRPQLRADRTYLIGPGTADLTDAVTALLLRCGAGAVTVLSPSPLAGATIAQATGAAARAEVTAAAAAGRPVAGVVWPALTAPGPAATSTSDPRAVERAEALSAVDRACADLELDVFTVCTSATSLWGGIGVTGQALSDGLVAELLAARRRRGQAAAAFVTAPWDVAGELDEGVRTRMHRLGVTPLPVPEALELLEQSLAEPRDDVVAVRADWGLVVPLYRQLLAWPLFDEQAEAVATGRAADSRSSLGADPHSTAQLVLSWVLEDLALVLGEDVDEVDPDRGFFDLGLNSVTAVELKVRLERRSGLPLPATIAFEHPTAAALAQHVLSGLTAAHVSEGAPQASLSANPVPTGGRSRRSIPAPRSAPDVVLTDEELLSQLDDELDAPTTRSTRRSR